MSADAESPARAAPITTAPAAAATATTTSTAETNGAYTANPEMTAPKEAAVATSTTTAAAGDVVDAKAAVPRPSTPTENNARKSPADVALPVTPKIHKPLPRDPPITPRVTKKVPWKGKKINILIPRDEDRGKPGKTPRPLRSDEVDRMFKDWKEFGYSVDGFDLLVDGFHPPGTDDSQSRADWPSPEDMARERGARKFKVLLPDLNAWANEMLELQEAKLRALGVSGADEEPTPSMSPITSDASRIASGQYPALPFSPPLPTSSASSNHALAGFPFHPQFLAGSISASQSPGIPTGASPIPFGMPGKFNPRQSISLPASASPFQVWPNQAAMMQGMNRIDSPGLVSLNGMISPAPYGIEGFQQSASPGLNAHARRQSLQYVNPQQLNAPSPHLEKVQEAEDEGQADSSKSASKTPEPLNKSRKQSQLNPQSAEYHLEEQFRNQLDHEDYNPHNAQSHSRHETLASLHERQASGNLQVSEHFANDQAQPVVLHHPRPHSRGQSLTQNFFDGNAPSAFEPLNQIPESKADVDANEQYEIETNPSNLGTPVQDFNFAAVLAPPQRATSTGSNPWQDSSMGNGTRKTSGGKPTFSKLNVKAPEFKFNPTSNFTPGAFSFSGASASFEPAVFTGANTYVEPEPEPESDLELVPAPSQFGSSFTNFNAAIPSFTPGNSTFSFSTSGPKFRPDAPSFTPFQSLGSNGGFQSRRTDSIFGNIVIDPELLQQPSRSSRAIPIVKPEASPAIPEEEDGDAMYDGDGRLTNETRAKRARSTAPTDADLLLASPIHEYESDSANIVTSSAPVQNKDSEADKPIKSTETVAPAKDVLPEEVITPRTSLSSKLWNALLNRSTDKPVLRRNDSIEMEKSQGHKHRRSLSASAPVFMPGASEYGSPVTDSKGNETPTSPLKQIHSPAPEEAPAKEPAVEEKPQPTVEAEPALSNSTTSKPTPDASDAGRASPKPKRKGLAASRFAKEAPVVAPATPVSNPDDSLLLPSSTGPLIDLAESKETIAAKPESLDADGEPTLEEIDAIMQHMKTDPSKGVNKVVSAAPVLTNPSPTKFPPSLEHIKSKLSATAVEFTPSARSSGHFHNPNLEDPFVDFGSSLNQHHQQEQQHHQQQTVFSQVDHFAPLQHAAFGHSTHATEDYTQHADPYAAPKDFGMDDGLATRLESMEKMLASLQHSLTSRSRHGASSRRDTRSLSGRDSDADDEDDEQPHAQRSSSPRKDRKMEQIRFAVMEALAAQPREVAPATTATNEHSEAVMSALEDIKTRLLTTSASAIGRSSEDGSRSLEADTPTLGSDVDMIKKMDELHNKVGDLDQKLYYEQTRVEEQIKQRRAAEEAMEELTKKLHAAETRVEVEIINKSAYDSRVADLEERLRQMEEKSEEEANMRRSTEERLAQSQSQLKVASEEEARLREVVEKKEHKIRELEQHSGKKTTRMAVLEAAHNTATQSKSDLANKLNVLETDLREVRQDNANLRTEVERADEKARSTAADLATALEDNKRLQQSHISIQVQLEENERLRESWRGKHETLQQTMADAARDIAEETARRIKKDEATLARQQQLDAHQEVLDARLQAEAKTRERLEVEMERLQNNERSGIRAVKECQRLETLLVEMRNDNHKLHQLAAQSKRESEEAREGGSLILERTKTIMQIEMEGLRRQLQEHVQKHHGIVQEHKNEIESHRAEIEGYKAEIESHKAAVENHRAQVEDHKTRADGVRERSASMLETAAASRQQEADELKLAHSGVIDDLKLAQITIVEDLKSSHAATIDDLKATHTSTIDDLKATHTSTIDDLKAQHERQLANAVEDGQRAEQALSERLGLSAEKLDHLTDKVAHLQDRNDHLEEKLSVAKQAAAAAAAAAKSAGVDTRALASVPVASPAAPVNKQLELPEKISPQALRESIMVLQEQLQAREQRIEELEQTVAKLDPEAPVKISKRDDEITWLRELLAVRHGDLQDIITALSTEQFDRERVKDASIRLKANLQMEEQERERAMNGGSAISLPNIAAGLQAATPRVAQAVGSGLNAWDRWRKSSQPFLSGVLSSPSGSVQSSGTPSRSKSSSFNLLTPPASGRAQPTAFSSTGRRYPSQKLAVNRVRSEAPETSSDAVAAVAEADEAESTTIEAGPAPEAEAPSTPPMTVQSGYDSDAQPGDFDENDFFED
ncbi:hypothetical protein VHEMI09169 [[Torrubiella] hemipterigena]|uniref:Myosin class II heavy chain n=1 Tax=[Torrubiella] hemipterigena TaxID=1531966 RepID=A0A0A1T900_9HYPO|nr:hypothetical protein VHEMI09169 [[Torrubiella] hemipterigena]